MLILFCPRCTTELRLCFRKRGVAHSLLEAGRQALTKNVLAVTVHECWLRSFWPGTGISWVLPGGVSSHSVHRVPRQGDLQLLHKLLQLLAGIVKSKKNVQVNGSSLRLHGPRGQQLPAEHMGLPGSTPQLACPPLSGLGPSSSTRMPEVSQGSHHCCQQLHIPSFLRRKSMFAFFSPRRPLPQTLKAGELESIISRCQVCMKRPI